MFGILEAIGDRRERGASSLAKTLASPERALGLSTSGKHSRGPVRTLPDQNIIVWASVGFVLLWLLAAIFSRGFGPADGATHYLYARFAFVHPSNFTDVWARPVCTIFYALPAVAGGRLGVCVASLAVALGCAASAAMISRDQGDAAPGLAFVFTLAQPLLFLHCLTAMTELPCALLLGAGFVAVSRSRFGLAALLAGLLPLARPEGFGFAALMAILLVDRRQFRWLPLVIAPLIAWSAAGWILDGRHGHWWLWLGSRWPYSSISLYGVGNPLAFVATLPVVVSPLLLPATILGITGTLAAERPRADRPLQLATVMIPLVILVIHSLLYATGRLGSFGEPRYMLIAAPFWGILSARGWTRLSDCFRWLHPVRWAAAAALFPVLIDAVHPVIPLRPEPDWQAAGRLADWYQRSGRQQFSHLLTAHPGIYLALDLSPSDSVTMKRWDRQTLLAPAPQTLLAWDPIYGPRNASAARAVTVDELLASGWIEDPQLESQTIGADAVTRLGWRLFGFPENPPATRGAPSPNRSSQALRR